MQCCGFSLPLTLSTLVTYIILFFAQGYPKSKDIIAIGHLFYLDKPQGRVEMTEQSRCWNQLNFCLALGPKLLVISLIGFLVLWLSKMKITSQVWFPTSERLAKMYKWVLLGRMHRDTRMNSSFSRLFVLPFYESAIVEQNLLLNKREKDEMGTNGKEWTIGWHRPALSPNDRLRSNGAWSAAETQVSGSDDLCLCYHVAWDHEWNGSIAQVHLSVTDRIVLSRLDRNTTSIPPSLGLDSTQISMLGALCKRISAFSIRITIALKLMSCSMTPSKKMRMETAYRIDTSSKWLLLSMSLARTSTWDTASSFSDELIQVRARPREGRRWSNQNPNALRRTARLVIAGKEPFGRPHEGQELHPT